jgi:HEAT repeat protein
MPQPARAVPVALCLALLAAAPPVLPPDPITEEDERLLREKAVPAAPAALLAHLRSHTLTPARRERIARLIRNLGSDMFEEREKASAGLLEAGPAALPLLRPVANTADLEVRMRARRAIARLEADRQSGLTEAVIRTLGRRPAPEAPAVLLAFLPDADDQEVEAIRAALSKIGRSTGKADPALVAALEDPEVARRAVAAEVLAGLEAHRPAVRRLLADRHPLVRLGAARGLAFAGERSAVPVLIDLLPELPPSEAMNLQDAFLRLAGERAPTLTFADTLTERKKDRDTWSTWWTKNGAAVDLSRFTDPGELGRTLLMSFSGTKACVYEKDRTGRQLWSIEGLQGAVDAHILTGNRVLIAELWAGKVTERDFAGKVLWEYKVSDPGSSGPVRCQRLPNGNTFISTMGRLLEIDRNGKQLFHQTGSYREAWKYPDGRIALVTGSGEYQLLDRIGKLEKSFAAKVEVGDALAGVEFLPRGGVLIARNNQLIEYSPDGKEVWKTSADQPYGLTRLANGNTLIALRAKREFVEVDRGGRVVKRFPVADTIPWRARRR